MLLENIELIHDTVLFLQQMAATLVHQPVQM